MEEMEFKDELPQENLLTKEHSDFKKFAKIIIIILLIIILLLAAGIILSFILKKDGEKGEKGEKGDKGDKGDSGDEGNKSIEEIIKEQTDKYRDAFGGEIIKNLYYAKDKVNNTFKSGGDNHREEIPIPNKGEDYKANDFNKYDLYIPYSALKENKTKGIFIIIHGGAWVGGRKEDNAFLAQIYYEHEFIVANLDYTLLSQTAPSTTNILRQIDEITACIEHLKNYLVERGFNKNELQVAVGGGSAGGHLALLYSYIVEKPPLDVKFIIDIIGPINLNIPDFLIVVKDEDTLPDFKPETIEEALKHREKYSHSGIPDNMTLLLLDLFIGGKYAPEELFKMLKNGTVDPNDERYIALINETKFGFPIMWMEREGHKNIPILGEYGGKDQLIGIKQPYILEQTCKANNIKFQMVYSRYNTHGFIELEHKEGKEAAKEFNYYFLKFADEYFIKY